MLHSQCVGSARVWHFSRGCKEEAYLKYPTALTHNLSPGIKFHPKLLGSIVQPWVVLGNQSLYYTVWPFV